MNDEWLQQLKVGDELFFGSWGSTPYPCTVTKITKTQIVVAYNDGRCKERFNRVSGRSIGGGSWHRNRLIQDTPEMRNDVEREMLRRKAHGMIQDLKPPKDKDGLAAFIAAITPYVKERE